MNPFDELRLHVGALSVATDANQDFFVSITHYVRRLQELVDNSPNDLTKDELQLLAKKIEGFFKEWRPTGDTDLLYVPPRQTADTDDTVQRINQLVSELAALPRAEFESLSGQNQGPAKSAPVTPKKPTARSPCVFIGHGRSKLWARVKVFLEDDLHLATVTYESEPRTGEAIVPVLERLLEQATFAALVFSAEDQTADGNRRARQNVVHEAGLFQGRLGFKKAVLLVQDGVEGFTNVDGLQHLPFQGDNVEQTFYELSRTLKRERQID